MSSEVFSSALGLSRFCRVRHRGNEVVVFHELHPSPLRCSAEDWQSFSSTLGKESNPVLFDGLLSRGLLVRNAAVDEAELRLVREQLEHKLDQPLILYLLLAQGCNCSCTYCPVPGLAKIHGETLLSLQDGLAGLNLWLEDVRESRLRDDVYLIFYGGEPLLNKPVLTAIARHVHTLRASDESAASIKMLIATNGVLIDDEILRLCVECDIKVTVGLDGPTPANDRLRVFPDGSGAFESAVASIRRLVSAGVDTSVSACITPFSLPSIHEMVPFLRELGVRKFGFNFLRGQALHELLPAEEVGSFHRASAKAVIKSFRDYGLSAFEYQMEKKWFAFTKADFFPVDCTCYGNQLVVHPDGQLSNCPFFRGSVGHVRDVGADFRIADDKVVKEWRQRLPLNSSAYENCDAKSLCGGGCTSGSLATDTPSVDLGMKIFAEEVFDDFLWSSARIDGSQRRA